MLDLNNRKYKSIEFFVSGELVCFEMENGLSYSVLLQKKEIIVCVYADSVLKYFDSVEPGNLISKEELDKAVAILKTALLPTYSNAKLKRMERAIQIKILEEKLNLKNRRYRNVVAYEPDNWACFEMENGLVYIVLLRTKRIAVRVDANRFIESCPNSIEGRKISKDELERAVDLLNTAPLLKINIDELKDMEYRVRFKLLEIKNLFRGTIQSLSLTNSRSTFPGIPEPGDQLKQRLTISSTGDVKLSREMLTGGWFRDKTTRTKTKKVKISAEDSAKIFDYLGNYFSEYHEDAIICDGGTWNLELTNNEGDTFRFSGTTIYSNDQNPELSSVSELIRKITGLEYLLGFEA